MTDHAELIERLKHVDENPDLIYQDEDCHNIAREAADAIAELQRERDDWAFKYNEQSDTYSQMHTSIEDLERAHDTVSGALATATSRIIKLEKALRLALECHGKMLMSDPPQDAWKARNVEAIALDALGDASHWQPMTSAPRDGTQILVKEHNGAVSIAAWVEDDDGKLVQQWRAFAQGWAIVELGPDYDGHHVDLDPAAWAAIPVDQEVG